MKLSMDSFKDKTSLMAAGVSGDYADSMMNRFKGMQNTLFAKGISAQMVDLAKLKSGSNQNPSSGQGSNQVGSLSQQDSANDRYATIRQQARGISSADPLTVNYNGEAIHINSADIFKVISTRYNANLPTLLPAE